MKKFETGHTYINEGASLRFKVLSRTESMVKVLDLKEGTIATKKIKIYGGSEYCLPLGSYSMAPTLRAENKAS
jgi:hypothetical protein